MLRSLHIANKIPHFPHSYPPCKLPCTNSRFLCRDGCFVPHFRSVLW
nr:MAG TPA: hypothetical protein [Caudoviricetes sp.]